MKIELLLHDQGGGDKNTALEVLINEKSVGTLTIPDEFVPWVIYKLVGKAKIISL